MTQMSLKAEDVDFSMEVQASRDASENKYGIAIRELVEPVLLAGPETPVNRIKKMIGVDEPIRAVVIVSEMKPVGLVMSLHLDRVLSHRYGVSLYYDKPVSRAMDINPLVVEEDTPLATVADLAMNRDKLRIYDHIIVSRGGKISGVVSVQNILKTLAAIQERNTVELNSINEQLQWEVDERKKAETELLKLNRELGDRVAERTAELQESNEKLRAAAEAAEAANRTKSDFLANMSHELRTPLNHIIGFTELLLEQHFGAVNETQSEYLTDVLTSGRHLLSLINDILDLSKVEAGKLELNSAKIDLKKILDNSLLMIKEKALKHGITLTTEIGNIPGIVEADERKLKQVLYNLLSNAIKFTPDGGSVRVAAEIFSPSDAKKKHLSIDAAEVGELVEISVMDTGIGLKEADMQRIFEPFEQVESSKTRRFQGTGLGLSLTKKLVELHNGRIWVESEGESKGSVFRVIIPCRQPVNDPGLPELMDSRQNAAQLGVHPSMENVAGL